jgi:hypothetical protein
MLWMKPGATLVNIAHGGVMDDAALASGEVDPALARRQKSDVARPERVRRHDVEGALVRIVRDREWIPRVRRYAECCWKQT